jgi:hypothetical protein
MKYNAAEPDGITSVAEINAWITLIKKDRQRRLRKLWRPVIWRPAVSSL